MGHSTDHDFLFFLFFLWVRPGPRGNNFARGGCYEIKLGWEMMIYKEARSENGGMLN